MMKKILSLLICILALVAPIRADVVGTIPAAGGTGGTLSSPLAAPAADNCAAVPYSFTSDTDTGICSSVADKVGISTGGSVICSFVKTASSTVGFETCTGTLPSATASIGVYHNITGAGAGAVVQESLNATLNAGSTSTSRTNAIEGNNVSLGTGTGPITNVLGNFGVEGVANSNTAGDNTGVIGVAINNGAGKAFGVVGRTVNTGGTNVALMASALNGATNNIAGLFTLSANDGTTTQSAAIVADNGTQAQPIAFFRDNGATSSSTVASAFVQITDGADIIYGNGTLTSATMTPETTARVKTVTNSYTWSNAQVVALGAALTGDIPVVTLPAKTRMKNAYVVISTAAAGVTTLTVSCGDAIGGTPFINYVIASDAKAAANTVYGDAVAERGTSIDVEWYYMPNYTASTLVTCHFISTGANLDQVTTSTGRVILTTELMP